MTDHKRLGYADPPYPGLAHLYADHPDFAGEVDHAALIRRPRRTILMAGSYTQAAWQLVFSHPSCRRMRVGARG